MKTDRRQLSRSSLFILFCAGCLALATGYVSFSSSAPHPIRNVKLPPIEVYPTNRAEFAVLSAGNDAPQEVATAEARTSSPEGQSRIPTLLVRHTGLDESYGTIAIEEVAAARRNRRGASLRCERVHFGGDRGICLDADRGFLTTYWARFFDRHFRVTHTVPLAGPPSRARVSRDGRYVATTVFVSGHSYVETGFSTQTSIWDAETGTPIIADLESLDVQRGGVRFANADFNFWGVTFDADGKRFYATLGTSGTVYLIEGDITRKAARVIREGVECPSLSPDGTRLVFKKRVPGRALTWRLHVLELRTFEETALAEVRSVDDQAEWLDNNRIVYGLTADQGDSGAVTDVWVVKADGTGEPELLLREAFSPALM